MISVCIAAYNGETYLPQQIESILNQIGPNDELIISDNGSTDNTIAVINAINDSRISLLQFPAKFDSAKKADFKTFVIRENFMNAIKHAKGDYIFMADQDDIWVENKVSVMLSYLQDSDVVVHNAEIVDSKANKIGATTYDRLANGSSLMQIVARSAFMGCCMAFKKELLPVVLSYPYSWPIEYDTWVGLCGKVMGKVKFIDEKLIFYRRHDTNASSCCNNSVALHKNLVRKLRRRYFILRQYFYLTRYKIFKGNKI